jgi:hypothetical protein
MLVAPVRGCQLIQSKPIFLEQQNVDSPIPAQPYEGGLEQKGSSVGQDAGYIIAIVLLCMSAAVICTRLYLIHRKIRPSQIHDGDTPGANRSTDATITQTSDKTLTLQPETEFDLPDLSINYDPFQPVQNLSICENEPLEKSDSEQLLSATELPTRQKTEATAPWKRPFYHWAGIEDEDDDDEKESHTVMPKSKPLLEAKMMDTDHPSGTAKRAVAGPENQKRSITPPAVGNRNANVSVVGPTPPLSNPIINKEEVIKGTPAEEDKPSSMFEHEEVPKDQPVPIKTAPPMRTAGRPMRNQRNPSVNRAETENTTKADEKPDPRRRPRPTAMPRKKQSEEDNTKTEDPTSIVQAAESLRDNPEDAEDVNQEPTKESGPTKPAKRRLRKPIAGLHKRPNGQGEIKTEETQGNELGKKSLIRKRPLRKPGGEKSDSKKTEGE